MIGTHMALLRTSCRRSHFIAHVSLRHVRAALWLGGPPHPKSQTANVVALAACAMDFSAIDLLL